MWSFFRRLDGWPDSGGGGSKSRNTILILEVLERRQMAAGLSIADVLPAFSPDSNESSAEIGKSQIAAEFAGGVRSQVHEPLSRNADAPDHCRENLHRSAHLHFIDLEQIARDIGDAFDLDDHEIWEIPEA